MELIKHKAIQKNLDYCIPIDSIYPIEELIGFTYIHINDIKILDIIFYTNAHTVCTVKYTRWDGNFKYNFNFNILAAEH
mgnify:CR=1 FL=1